MLRTTLHNALKNFLALHSKVADDNETVIICGERNKDVAWIDAHELEQLRAITVRWPTSDEIVRELEGGA